MVKVTKPNPGHALRCPGDRRSNHRGGQGSRSSKSSRWKPGAPSCWTAMRWQALAVAAGITLYGISPRPLYALESSAASATWASTMPASTRNSEKLHAWRRFTTGIRNGASCRQKVPDQGDVVAGGFATLVDAATICTPTVTHYEIGKFLLEKANTCWWRSPIADTPDPRPRTGRIGHGPPMCAAGRACGAIQSRPHGAGEQAAEPALSRSDAAFPVPEPEHGYRRGARPDDPRYRDHPSSCAVAGGEHRPGRASRF